MATTPDYSLRQARQELHALIGGWAQYQASEQQLAQLRGILASIDKVINQDTRMNELRSVDGRPYTVA